MISSRVLHYILLISMFLWIACESPQGTQRDNTDSSPKVTNSETSTVLQAPQTPPAPPHTMPTITQHDKVSYQIFETDTPKAKGFGYDILIGRKKFLHQPNIPAINGYKAFKQRKDAEKVASLVVFKITNNIMPPSISVKELDSLKIYQ